MERERGLRKEREGGREGGREREEFTFSAGGGKGGDRVVHGP